MTGITENWSAYAPGFEELDENVEYQEKEDEFDIVRDFAWGLRKAEFPIADIILSRFQEDESIINQRKADMQDRPVDIMTVQRARSASPPIDIDDAFEEFVSIEQDEDIDEAFYPAPELDGLYEEEQEALQSLGGEGLSQLATS